MKFRIYRKGAAYFPQYSFNDNVWFFFEKKEYNRKIDLYRCILKFYSEKHNQSFKFDDLFFPNVIDKNVLGFIDMLTAYTFIGAATYFYSEEKIDINLNS